MNRRNRLAREMTKHEAPKPEGNPNVEIPNKTAASIMGVGHSGFVIPSCLGVSSFVIAGEETMAARELATAGTGFFGEL
jgi:hypothetical protein